MRVLTFIPFLLPPTCHQFPCFSVSFTQYMPTSSCKPPDPHTFAWKAWPPAHLLCIESLWHSLEKEARNRLHRKQLSGHGRLLEYLAKCLEWKWGSQMLIQGRNFFSPEGRETQGSGVLPSSVIRRQCDAVTKE